MTQPFLKSLKVLPLPLFPNYLDDDLVLDDYQQKCIKILDATTQFEEEAYISEHPEIRAMLITCFARAIQNRNKRQHLKFLGQHFSRPFDELDREIREFLKIPSVGPYCSGYHQYEPMSIGTMKDLWNLNRKSQPQFFDEQSSEHSASATLSSSFLSVITSNTTFETPEPSPVRSPTTSEIFYGILSRIVDKATITGIQDYDILYDAAYVEVMKAVENAIEITVIDIKADIRDLLNTAYRLFIVITTERARLVAEENWEKRMRKKLKKTLRRADNFKGYETPPTSKSHISSHESYKRPPPPPCECHPQFHYNRYPKDRFGIYLPQEEQYCNDNITSTPIISDTNLIDSKSHSQKQIQENKKNIESFKTTSKSSINELDKQQDTNIEGKSSSTNTDNSVSTEINKISYSNALNSNQALLPGNVNVENIKVTSSKNIKCPNDGDKNDINAERLKKLTFTKQTSLNENYEDAKQVSKNGKTLTKLNTIPQPLTAYYTDIL